MKNFLRYPPLLLLCSLLCCNCLCAQYLIQGKVETGGEVEIAYLSILKAWDDFQGISSDMIIRSAKVDNLGYFEFSGNELAEQPAFYRIHFSPEGETPVFLSGSTVPKNYINFIHSNQDTFSFQCRQVPFGPSEIEMSSSASDGEKYLALLREVDELRISKGFPANESHSALVDQKIEALVKPYLNDNNPLISLYALNCLPDFYEDGFRKYVENFEQLIDPLRDGGYENYANSLAAFVGSKSYGRMDAQNRRISRLASLGWTFAGLFFLATLYLLRRNRQLQSQNKLHGQNQEQGVQAAQTAKVTQATQAAVTSLTSKERQVFKLIQAHKTNKEIAAELFISAATVKTHISNIYRKLGVSGRKELLDQELED